VIAMPHIIVKVRAGYPKAKKARLAEELAKAIVATLDCPNFDVSVGIEDVRPAEWTERVYRPDILGKPKTIYKQPGYTLTTKQH
jgi:4-oxalocrotonate tautomerase